MRVACVGGGPAGLYFAILMKLRDRDHAVTVYERNPPGVTYGWGVTLWDGTLAHLRRGDPDLAARIERHLFRWSGLVFEVSGAAPERAEGSAFSIRRRDLLDLLEARALEVGVDVHHDHEVETAESIDGDLVVAGDGVGSRLREPHSQAFGTEMQLGRNRYVWLGTTQVFDAFMFAFAPTEAGLIWFYGYGTDEATSTVVVECTPETWTGLGLDGLDPEHSLALLRRLFAQQLGGHELIARPDEERLPWSQFRTVTNRVWHHGRTVLAGDAAHTTHFSIGSGTTLAIDDSIALAEALDHASDLSVALEAYGASRRAEISSAQVRAQRSARFFEAISRYADLAAPDLARVVRRRDSPLVHQLPPALYCRLHGAADEVPALRWARNLAGRTADALLSR